MGEEGFCNSKTESYAAGNRKRFVEWPDRQVAKQETASEEGSCSSKTESREGGKTMKHVE